MSSYRKGRFTSSSIHKLVKTGRGKAEFSAPGLSYIKEKKMELLTGRSFDLDIYSQAIAWGNLMEKIVFELLPLDYKLVSNDPEIYNDHFGGTVDCLKDDTVAEIKCYQLKKFAEYTRCLMVQDVEEFKSEFPQEFWQIVSNSIIYNKQFGEAISYMPYKNELEQIRADIEETNMIERWDFEPWQYRFMSEKNIDDLAWIEKGGYFKNITIFRFEVPNEDKEFLMARVEQAIELIK